MLGGLRYLLPVIQSAQRLGYYIITCDYLPDNIAHKHSNEYHNISILDKNAIFKLAKKLQIDGIMSFAVDPGVLTAAYVAEKLGLPSCGPYESVKILQNKSLFRKFLADNNFNVPKAKSYVLIEDALDDIDSFSFPIIVKPIDSAGSKGVTKVVKSEELQNACSYALSFSQSKKIIIEEFIESEGFPSDSEGFSINGELVCCSFSDQRFDITAPNPFTPSAFSWPSTIPDHYQNELKSEIQRLLSLLQMQTSIYNIETRLGKNGKAYIMEVSPRGGGNRLAEMLHFASGIDLITAAVRGAVGEKIETIPSIQYNGHWAEYILHSNRNGTFQGVEINDIFKQYVIELDLWIKQGDKVSEFSAANTTIGTIVLKFESEEQLTELMNKRDEYIQVITN